MIEVFKIVTGKYDSETVVPLELTESIRTRGNKYKLIKKQVKYDLRKFYFTNRVVDVWNSLPDYVVDVETVNLFKNRLDKFWSNQALIYDYRADIAGIGSRSYDINNRT